VSNNKIYNSKKNKSIIHNGLSDRRENKKRKTSNTASFNIKNFIYGKHPVLMAVLYHKRNLKKLFATDKMVEVFNEFVTSRNVWLPKDFEINVVQNDFFENDFLKNSVHQGILLECSNIPKMSLDVFLNENINKKILIIDEITDPHNIGAIFRSAVAFGFSSIIISSKNFPSESAVVAKSSAGMVELVDLIEVVNINSAIHDLKNNGYWVVGLAGESNNFISEVKFDKVALIVGSEGNGIRDLVKKNCDMLVKIPMEDNVESLNASVAAAVAMYEINK